jgi:hypothetical protein
MDESTNQCTRATNEFGEQSSVRFKPNKKHSVIRIFLQKSAQYFINQ